MANELVLSGSVWKFRQKTTGTSNEADIDPDSLQSDIKILDSGSGGQYLAIPMVNQSATPTVVELRFSGSYLAGSDDIAYYSWDSGSTADSPSYSIDPDINITPSGSIRYAQLKRTASVPITGSSSLRETIDFYGPSGLIESRQYDIFPLNKFLDLFNSFATPRLSYNFKNGFVNSGSLGSSWDLSVVASGNSNLAAYADSSTYFGLEGYAVSTSASGDDKYAYISSVNLSDIDIRVANRTVVIVLDPLSGISQFYTSGVTLSGLVPRYWYMTRVTSTNEIRVEIPSAASTITVDLDTTHSHSSVANSEAIDLGSANNPILIALTNPGAGQDLILRWKQKGHGSGFSYLTSTAPTTTLSSTGVFVPIGTNRPYNNTYNLRYLFWGMSDYALSDSDFSKLADGMGI